MRLFVAVNAGGAAAPQLWDLTSALREKGYPVRWVGRDAFHITVKFLGEVAESLLPELRVALNEIAADFGSFELEYGGCGAFPTPSRPKVLWAGCEAQPTFELLQHELETRFEQLGFATEGKPFRPHVTLGRVRRNAGRNEVGPLVAALEGLEFCIADQVESIDLMSSTPGPGGARYDLVHRAHLGVA